MIILHTLRNLVLVDGDWSGVVALSGSTSFVVLISFFSKQLSTTLGLLFAIRLSCENVSDSI